MRVRFLALVTTLLLGFSFLYPGTPLNMDRKEHHGVIPRTASEEVSTARIKNIHEAFTIRPYESS